MRENVRNPHAHRSATDDQDLRSGSQALTAHRLRGTRGPDPTWVWFPINTRQWPVVRGGGRKPSLESCPLPSPASQGEWTVCSRVQTRPSGGPLAAPLRAAAGLGAMQSHGPQGQRPEGRQCSQQEQQGSQDLPRPPDPLGWAVLSSCGGGGGAAPRARKERGRLEAPPRAAAEGLCSLESPNPAFQKGTGSQRKHPAWPCRECVLLGRLLFLPLNQRNHLHAQSLPPPLEPTVNHNG